MSMHTAGPWSIKPRMVLEDLSVYPTHIVGGVADLQVCLLESPAVAHLIQNDSAWGKCDLSAACDANARLIAAAPDLLGALREASDYLRMASPGNAKRVIDAAIAKAVQP